MGQCFLMLYIPRDRVDDTDLRTGLNVAETSSRPIKATLKSLKIAIFSLQNLPEGRETEYHVIKEGHPIFQCQETLFVTILL